MMKLEFFVEEGTAMKRLPTRNVFLTLFGVPARRLNTLVGGGGCLVLDILKRYSLG